MREDPHEALAERYRQSLTPIPPAIDQQTLWFEAGRASVATRRSGRLLKVYSGAMTALAASLALVMSRQDDLALANRNASPTPAVVTDTSRVEPPAAPVDAVPAADEADSQEPSPGLWATWFPPRPSDPNSYLARRERALRGDLDSLSRSFTRVDYPDSDTVIEPAPPATRQRLLEEYLPDRNRRPPSPPADDPRTESNNSNTKELA